MKATISALCTIMICGCSSASQFEVTQSPSRKFQDFGQVEVRSFSVDMTKFSGLEQDAQKQIQQLPSILQARLVKRIAERKLFPNTAGERLQIGGRIGEYDPGDRTARWLLGFGAGEGKITAQVVFTDGSGNYICRGTATGKVQWGTVGGSMDSAADELAEAIVDFIGNALGRPKEPSGARKR